MQTILVGTRLLGKPASTEALAGRTEASYSEKLCVCLVTVLGFAHGTSGTVHVAGPRRDVGCDRRGVLSPCQLHVGHALQGYGLDVVFVDVQCRHVSRGSCTSKEKSQPDLLRPMEKSTAAKHHKSKDVSHEHADWRDAENVSGRPVQVAFGSELAKIDNAR